MKFKNLLRFWPIAVLILLEIILFVANYKPGTFLMGWDNVMPEFNFKANIISNFFGVWQEHRGLGLYDGMSHSANILHTLFLWVLSIVLPLNLLRYIFTFFIHFLGGVGMYMVLRYLRREENHASTISLMGALFYELNIATITMFFTPLESFSIHFAILPWLALMLISYFTLGTKKSLLWLLVIMFLGTAQFFVTTLLIPIIILLGVFSLYYFITSARTELIPIIKRVVVIWISFLMLNAFWLLPYIYGLPKNAPVIQSAKINQQSTPEAFAKNLAFGDLTNVLLLRGFALDSEIISDSNTSFYLMGVWRSYINTPGVLLISYIFAWLAIIGMIKIFISKNSRYIPFVAIFFIGFFMLGSDVIGLRSLNEYLRSHIPIFNEAFRFPFTKFSLLYVFAYSILITYGVATSIAFLKVIKKRTIIIPLCLILAIGYISFPVWKGNFLFSSMRVKLPQEYLQVFNYMQAQDASNRVALLPQVSYWSFKQYSWGYIGSGFFWYGVSQPTLDRAFDPWSIENENYYWELSRAFYTKKPEQIEKVFDKYNIRFIILDENLAITNNYPASLIDDTKKIMLDIPNIAKKSVFGKLTIYERIKPNVKSFISIKQNLPMVWPVYHSNDNDTAYQQLGDYININKVNGDTPGVYVFPYRAISTKRSSNERELKIVETDDQIKISESGEEKLIPKKDRLVFDSTPTNVLLASSVTKCGGLRNGTIKAENIIGINEVALRLSSLNQRACLLFGMPDLWHKEGYLLAIASKNIAGRPSLFSVINQTTGHIELETYLPVPIGNLGKVEWLTTYFILPPLAMDGLGYTFYLANDSIGSRESINEILHVYMYNIPYEEITQTVLTTSQGFVSGSSLNNNQFTVEHHNPPLYIIKINDNVDFKSATLFLSQSFDPGWQAWVYPGKFPLQRLEEHVLIDNWANGWKIKPNQTGTVIIFFWPQLLEFLGFGLVIAAFAWIMKYHSDTN